MVTADQRINLERVSLIIYTHLDEKSIYFYRSIHAGVFRNAHNISVLVITHCDSKSDAAHTSMVEKFKSNGSSKDFAAIMGKEIYTVCLPNLDDYFDDDDIMMLRNFQN